MPEDDTTVRERDAHTVGLVFVGVLFAAVVTKILELSSAPGLPRSGAAQLGLAALVTITSWIGYHNSANRSTYKMNFFNLPLVLFVIEMVHVYLYWLAATTAETAERPMPSAVPETLLVAAVFALYVIWDQTALRIRRSPKYSNQPRSSEQPGRRQVTMASFLVAAALAAGVFTVKPRDELVVLLLDAGLAVLIVGHRTLQHAASRPRNLGSSV